MSTRRGSGKEVAFAGQRVRQKVLLAIVLSAVIPLLVLTYVLHVHIVPRLDPGQHGAMVMWVQLLMVCVGILVTAGAWVVWDLAAAVTRSAAVIAGGQREHELTARGDEIGTILQSFARMITTIETQAQEITASATQLDTAYRDLESANVQLKELSFTDPVTGLYNRRFFSLRLDEELSRYRRMARSFSVVLLDLDGFKDVNDRMGHAAGDETLRAIAGLLLATSRGINVVSRFGGDEFAVLLAETDKAGALAYGQRLCRVIEEHAFEPGTGVTASIGIATLPDDGVDVADAVLRAADVALYAAKRAGKNTALAYDPADVVAS